MLTKVISFRGNDTRLSCWDNFEHGLRGFLKVCHPPSKALTKKEKVLINYKYGIASLGLGLNCKNTIQN